MGGEPEGEATQRSCSEFSLRNRRSIRYSGSGALVLTILGGRIEDSARRRRMVASMFAGARNPRLRDGGLAGGGVRRRTWGCGRWRVDEWVEGGGEERGELGRVEIGRAHV